MTVISISISLLTLCVYQRVKDLVLARNQFLIYMPPLARMSALPPTR